PRQQQSVEFARLLQHGIVATTFKQVHADIRKLGIGVPAGWRYVIVMGTQNYQERHGKTWYRAFQNSLEQRTEVLKQGYVEGNVLPEWRLVEVVVIPTCRPLRCIGTHKAFCFTHGKPVCFSPPGLCGTGRCLALH